MQAAAGSLFTINFTRVGRIISYHLYFMLSLPTMLLHLLSTTHVRIGKTYSSTYFASYLVRLSV